uniref:Uncharacterized protein n=1 Tax=Dromaius novaehollandiae TaxID=8790 RepID=A0A8C4PEK0_DRONO
MRRKSKNPALLALPYSSLLCSNCFLLPCVRSSCIVAFGPSSHMLFLNPRAQQCGLKLDFA